MVEQNLSVPTGWWVQYKTGVKTVAFAIGWLHDEPEPGVVKLTPEIWHSGLGGVGFVRSDVLVIHEDDIIMQGPVLLGRKVSKEEHEEWLASQKPAAPAAPDTSDGFVQFRRKENAELRPYVPGESIDHVSVSATDAAAGSPKLGDMIARNPKNHADQWLVAAKYFRENFEPL